MQPIRIEICDATGVVSAATITDCASTVDLNILVGNMALALFYSVL